MSFSENGTAISNRSFVTIDTILNDNRTDVYPYGYNKDICEADTNNIPTEMSDDMLPVVIYRYKFTEEFMEELYNFSKIHQYDDRKDFKEAWVVWTEENDDLIDAEMRRLLNLGYEGDILNKMFKSARYYFRKKSTEKKEPAQRRQYISVNRELLDAMDNHIQTKIYEIDYQPKTGFIEFCKENETILKDTIVKIFEKGIRDSDLIEHKIKKTYKNRYFILTSKKL